MGETNRENSPLAIVLGGTVPHKALINNLKERGWRTLLVDYYDHPPAAKVADRHIQESTLDKEKVLEIAQRERASLVISGCIDQANATACYVAEKLGLPAPYSYETSLRVTDKELMKRGLVHAGVPTAEFVTVQRSDIATFQWRSFPVVVKPSDCNGSKGVRKVNDAEELRCSLTEAVGFSRTNKAIVEAVNSGHEISGYYYLNSKEPEELYIKSKQIPGSLGRSALQSFISIGPAYISETARANLRLAVKGIGTEFRLSNTPILVQAHVDGDDVKVIEFAPRVGGGLAFREIHLLTGFDIIDSVICSYIGESVDVSCIQNPSGMASVVHLYGTGGVFSRVEGMEILLTEGVIEEFHMHKTPGMRMSSDDLASRNRVLGVIVRGETVAELIQKTDRMVSDLRIMSEDEIDVTNRRVFSKIMKTTEAD